MPTSSEINERMQTIKDECEAIAIRNKERVAAIEKDQDRLRELTAELIGMDFSLTGGQQCSGQS